MLKPYDDDPDDPEGDERGQSPLRTLGLAVLTAGLVSVATELAEWFVFELREKFGTKPPPPPPPKGDDKK